MNDPLLFVLIVFVAVCAVVMILQLIFVFGLYQAAKKLQEAVMPLLPQAKSLMARADSILDDNKQNIVDLTRKANEITAKAAEITQKGNEIMDLAKAQVVKLDAVVTDAANRTKSQLERAELVVDDTMNRMQDSVAAIHNGVLRPIREINGVAAGVRTAVSVFLRGNRPNVAQVTQDDEMFI